MSYCTRDITMLPPTSLTLLLLVISVSLVLDVSEAGRPVVNKSYSAEGQKIMKKIRDEYDGLIQSFTDYSQQMKENYQLQPIEQAYNEAYARAEGTSCAGKDPDSGEIYTIIHSYVIQCQNSLQDKMLDIFLDKIESTKSQVEQIENRLQVTCASDPNSSDEAMRKANDQLSLIRTQGLDAKLSSDASDVLEMYKKNMDNCFHKKIADGQKQFVQFTKDINECLG